MRLSSSLLARLIASLGDKVAGRESLQVSDLQIPAAISPIISITGSIPGRIEATPPGTPTVPTRESYWFTAAGIQAPSSAGLVVPLGWIAKGPWRLFFSMSTWSDFQMTPIGPFNYVSLLSPLVANDIRLIRTMPATNAPQIASCEIEVILDTDAWQLRGIAGATAAAQNLIADFTVVARRLL